MVVNSTVVARFKIISIFKFKARNRWFSDLAVRKRLKTTSQNIKFIAYRNVLNPSPADASKGVYGSQHSVSLIAPPSYPQHCFSLRSRQNRVSRFCINVFCCSAPFCLISVPKTNNSLTARRADTVGRCASFPIFRGRQ